MYKFSIIFLIILISFIDILSQPDLKIEPRNVKFESIFDRYDYAIIYNDGDQVLSIDSLSTLKPYYLIDFENGQQLPISLNPDDTIKMNIVLSNFYNITVSDTTDTIWVYSNDPESPRDLRIKIDFFDDDFGNCSGTISDETFNPVPNSKIYFFYYGIYLFDSTYTDDAGIYNQLLPTGDYTVAAEKDGFRVMFSGNTPDPFFAQPVRLDSGQTINVDLTLPSINNTGFSVSGVIIDSISGITIDKGVIIVRKGTHTPTLLKQNALVADSTVYAGFVKPDGTYNIVVEDGAYYFVQGYSDYYLPTYFNSQSAASVFWQGADTLLINQPLADKNLYLERDSSYGGGGAYGMITLPFIDASGFDGISVFAKSINNNQLYSYNFGKEDGRFNISNLPYGTYQLIAQKVGFENATSNQFTISPQNQNQFNLNIQFTLTGIDEEERFMPAEIYLNPNYPNPFNPTTTISFVLPSSQIVKIKVFNLLGEEVAKIGNQFFSAGIKKVIFNANGFASGIYLVLFETKSQRLSQKIALMK